ncbi:MAG: GvpL/GvpF family gas vesicle protein [Nanoarchaeota archaeon]|nr:GvpL/GvpF family gas vesicle protein [Nanoarchaeota archaeon]
METETEECAGKGQMEADAQESARKEQKYRYFYVYGIVMDKKIKIEVNGLKDKPIKGADLRDFVVLFSAYPALHPLLEEEEALRHADILKKIAEKTTVIPMSFGTVFKTKKILKKVLQSSYSVFKETFSLIENKVELGVKVIKNQADEVQEEVQRDILESLNKLSIKSVKGSVFSDRLVLNHSCLVEKDKFAEFSEEIEKLENRHKSLKFVYTGPWPPYSFVNIKISGGEHANR